jgi:hypothetical protein
MDGAERKTGSRNIRNKMSANHYFNPNQQQRRSIMNSQFDARRAVVLAALALLLINAHSGFTRARVREYSFESFEGCPGCSTSTGGINNSGVIGVGVRFPGQFFSTGYIYYSRTHVSTPIPNSIGCFVPNNRGQITIGAFAPAGQIVTLLRERDGSMSPLENFPGAPLTLLIELNDTGSGTGYATRDFTSFFGVIRDRDGHYTEINYPAPLPLGTFPLGINASGTIVGYTSDMIENRFQGFVREPDGTWLSFAIPGASDTLPYAINNRGDIVGGYRDATGWHGFIQSHEVTQTVDFPGALNTIITGINDRGELVGHTFSSPFPLAPPFQAFIARPQSGKNNSNP